MGDLANTLLNLLRSRQQWISMRGGVAASIVATFLAMTAFLFVSQDWEWPNWLRLSVAVPLGGLFFGLWYIGREGYLRGGSGRRVGIHIHSVAVPPEHLALTLRGFESIAAETPRGVTVRVVPAAAVQSVDASREFQEKYQFDALLHIRVSPATNDANRLVFNVALTNLSRSELQQDFAMESMKHLAQLASRQRKQPVSTMDLLQRKGESLFEVVLAAIAIISYTESEFDEAASLLSVLDRLIASRFKPDEKPRAAFRWLHYQCLIRPSSYSAASPHKTPEELDAAITKASEAIERFGTEFYEVYPLQARNLFFKNDLDAAVAAVERVAVERCPPFVKAVVALDKALLHLILGHWENAARFYAEFLSMPAAEQIDWEELIRFADTAREMGHEPAIYAQCLYRKVFPKTVLDPSMDAALQQWLKADPSRNSLRTLYYRAPKFKRLATSEAIEPKGLKAGHASKKKRKFKRR
jgi:hypothetical protein